MLEKFTHDFAEGLALADRDRPSAVNARSKVAFQPGIGPHSEAKTVELVMQKLAVTHPDRYAHYAVGVPYPEAPRQKCDLCIGPSGNWQLALEVKLARFFGDNGKINDNILMHLLSPYPEHRSAVTDCEKLARSKLCGDKAVLIFGFDHDGWSLDPAIDAFETLVRSKVQLGPRHVARFADLVHPVHSRGRVFGWRICFPIAPT
jgi:hypothetical protein